MASCRLLALPTRGYLAAEVAVPGYGTGLLDPSTCPDSLPSSARQGVCLWRHRLLSCLGEGGLCFRSA